MNHVTKLFLTMFLAFFAGNISHAQLVAGDIAFIGVNEDAGPVGGTDHSFTWIALTDISAGEVIYFTEQGVNANTNTWFANTIEGKNSIMLVPIGAENLSRIDFWNMDLDDFMYTHSIKDFYSNPNGK